MQVDFKTDELIPCLCGFKPDHYSVSYGPTPYDVFCPECKKQASLFTKYKVSGSPSGIISYWNNHCAKMTKEELKIEYDEFKKEQEKETGSDGYVVYQYYWNSDGTTQLVKHC